MAKTYTLEEIDQKITEHHKEIDRIQRKLTYWCNLKNRIITNSDSEYQKNIPNDLNLISDEQWHYLITFGINIPTSKYEYLVKFWSQFNQHIYSGRKNGEILFTIFSNIIKGEYKNFNKDLYFAGINYYLKYATPESIKCRYQPKKLISGIPFKILFSNCEHKYNYSVIYINNQNFFIFDGKFVECELKSWDEVFDYIIANDQEENYE